MKQESKQNRMNHLMNHYEFNVFDSTFYAMILFMYQNIIFECL